MVGKLVGNIGLFILIKSRIKIINKYAVGVDWILWKQW